MCELEEMWLQHLKHQNKAFYMQVSMSECFPDPGVFDIYTK